MSLRLIPANEYRRERWRNGLGWTREIARGPVEKFESPHKGEPETAEQLLRRASGSSSNDDPGLANGNEQVRSLAEGPAQDWDWRLSIAEIDSDCAFSAFPGCDRVLLLLSGNGMELDFDDGEACTVAPPHGRVAFAGERDLRCRLLDGPTTDFNAIVRRDRCTLQLWRRPLVGSMVFFAEAGVLWAIHLIAGRGTIKSAGESATLDAGDTALLETGVTDASVRSILDGGGDVVLVKIQRKA